VFSSFFSCFYLLSYLTVPCILFMMICSCLRFGILVYTVSYFCVGTLILSFILYYAVHYHRGRYDLRRTPAENINLPPALLSRFDLLWLILDKADMDSDLEMARHVLYVHQKCEPPALGFTPLESSILR
jgi:hypothetical protein